MHRVDDGVEQIFEIVVRLGVSSMAAHERGRLRDARVDGTRNGPPRGTCGCITELRAESTFQSKDPVGRRIDAINANMSTSLKT